MEADWEELQLVPHPGPGVNSLPTPVTVLGFDPSQELLWTGSEYGRLMSFYGAELQKYTSYKGHASESVKQMLFTDKGVLSVSAHSVHLSSRPGLTIWHLTNDLFRDLQCMSFTSKGTHEVLVAGCQETMFKIDVENGTISETIQIQENYTIMKKAGQFICAATNTGAVHILDPTTLQPVKTWQAHLGWINDMDAKFDYLVTCGWSPRQQHGYMLDPLANVFSLKTLQPLPPIPFQPGAAFVRMHPRMSTTCIIASQTGQLQVVDIHNPNTVNLKQARVFENTYLNWLEMAPSGEALALGNSMCQIHLWGSPTKMQFAEYSNPTSFADATPQPSPSLDWPPDSRLNDIGMPYYREILLSAWPPGLVSDVGAPPPKIDPQISTNLKRTEFGSYAPNLRNTRRNQVQDTRDQETSNDPMAAPKFLSEKAREAASAQTEEKRIGDALDSLDIAKDVALEGVTKEDVPVIYRNVEIKYSKFGVDDFDFEYYNKTKFSGLETHIANSYANPLLQLFRFIPVIRNLALRHTATSCLYDHCLLCELGFLIDMLEKASGRNCQATNFLKTFSGNPTAGSLNLLEEHSPNTALTVLIQSVNRFLLEKFTSDYRQMSPQARHMEQALATKVTATIRCAHCTHEQMRAEDPYVHELIYPPKNTMRNSPRTIPRFTQILKASVERQEQTRGWCPRCKRYQQLSTRKQVQSIPAVLMINAAIHSAESKQLWAIPHWLPQEIGVIVERGQFFCYEGQDLKLHIQRGAHNIQVYELVGTVADINSGENQKPHLVSLIDVALSSTDTRDTNEWHLFNDFLVRQTSKEDALRFDPSWKLPSVLAYQLKSAGHMIDDSWKSHLDTSLLYGRWSPIQDERLDEFRLLSPNETPHEGTPVGIDAEFVSLQREEIEIKADGKRETIRPSRMGLARVSVLRGEPATEDADGFGLPFIDDYIAVSEPVVDYLTVYSGIRPGDLDRSTSRHALVSLKNAYKKLWLLLNLGVVFVGHGLLKDFRTINIHVPKAQVIDTVDLFYLPARQRKISLRFLASLLLGEDIQTDMHDSIEDARTALRLWLRYQEIKEGGDVEETLEWIYKTGYETGWKAEGGAKGDFGTSGALTPFGRNTPEPGARPSSSGIFDGSSHSGTNTPVRRAHLLTTLSPPPR